MNKDSLIAALEIFLIIACSALRLACICYIVYELCDSDISQGWKVVLLIITILCGLTFDISYKNDSSATDKENIK